MPQAASALRLRPEAKPAFTLAGDRAVILIGAFLIAAALTPTLLVRIPSMVDYLNQIARMDILARAGGPDASPFYDVAWKFYPNLAIDVLVPPIARLIGPVEALRLFLLLSQILIISGAAALELAVKGRIRLSPFVSCLFLYSLPFTLGFLNFEFGLGLALWALAAMLAVKDRSPLVRFGLHSAFCAALFVSHLFAFGVYGAALGLYELSQFRNWRQDGARVFLRLAMLAPPAIALFAIVFVSVGTIGGQGNRWLFSTKALVFFNSLNAYSYEISGLLVALLIAGTVMLAMKGALMLSRPGVFIAVGFAALFLLLPSRLFGTSFADVRVLPGAALILPAFLHLRLPNREWRVGAAAAVSLAALANIAFVYGVWQGAAPDYREFMASTQKLSPGARVITAHSEEGRDPPADLADYPFYHLATLVVPFADGFTPTVFTEPGKQPIRPKECVRSLDVGVGGPVPAARLLAAAEGRVDERAPAFLRDWPEKFDYLYVVGPAKPNPLPSRLDEIMRGRKFVLYRIRKAEGL